MYLTICTVITLISLWFGFQWYLFLAILLSFNAFCALYNELPFNVTLEVLGLSSLIISMLLVPVIRRNIIGRFIFAWFKKVLPPLSKTEEEAIESGDVWWEADIFRGLPDWNKFNEIHLSKLTTEESKFLNTKVKTFLEMINDWDISTTRKDLTEEAWDYLKKEKFFAMLIPKSYGGLEFSSTANSCIVERIATKSSTAAVTVMVPNSLGPSELLVKYGTEDQKNHYLPRLANGEEVPCFALTGIEVGSDATAMPDTGVVCKGMHEGKEVVGIKLNWNKRYITLAPVATLMGLAFKLYDPDNLLGPEKERGITLCLLSTKLEGIEIGNRHNPLNTPFMNGPIKGKDVFVPLDCIIGGEKYIGCGWKMLVECLGAGRGISLPAIGTASCKVSFRTTSAYASIRTQFGLPIGDFDGVAKPLGEIGGYTFLVEATRRFTLTAIDLGLHPSVITAISKYHLTEIGRQVINDAMDIHAGKAIIAGPGNYLASAYQAIPVGITVEGANILTRCLMIFGQGAIRCHPYVLKEMLSVKDNNLTDFDTAFASHVAYTVRNFVKLIIHGVTGFYLTSSPLDFEWKKSIKEYNRLALLLSCVSDLAMLFLGGKLKREENQSARLGDALSYLFMASASIKLFQDNQGKDKLYFKWAMNHCLFEAETAIVNFLRNLPWGMFKLIGEIFFFPFGRRIKSIPDQLTQNLAKHMRTLSDTRLRLAECGFDHDTGDAKAVVEQTFNALHGISDIQKQIHKAIKQKTIRKNADFLALAKDALAAQVISTEAYEQLEAYNRLRLSVIEVDDFPPTELSSL